MNLMTTIAQAAEASSFSGTVLVKRKSELLAETSYGYANRSDRLKPNQHTRYGIASGCKLFTAIAISQLVEQGKLTYDTKLTECLTVELPSFDEEITVHHLLTHTSGVPDYFDEDVMDDFEELWIERPMYHIRSLEAFLPLFQSLSMKFKPGERFHYNNAGYILLGLIVEQVSGRRFDEYVQTSIFDRAGMEDSGYFELDALPANTAIGYIDRKDGTWKTNVFSVPAKGGSDGGAFVTAPDMDNLWDALMQHRLLSEATTTQLLAPHAHEGGEDYYGYGIWIKRDGDGAIRKYHVMGYDPGVSFHSAYYPMDGRKVIVCSNQSSGAFAIMKAVEEDRG
ncbi:serine hydrolase [Gorillibacterium sp. CAU 1737]|uniref:serine hydrolase domain-containing protein n=1 Tax=Gorillibacterium sp. CAU 1737 TaxID=3140362 RepID=UPI003260AE6D